MIRLKQSAKLLLVLLLFYFVCRLLFLLFNYSHFRGDSFVQIASAFFYGLRFDLSSIFATNILFLTLFLLPHPFRNHKYYRLICAISFLIPNFLAMAANCADLVYFGFTGKRTTFDVFAVMGKDLGTGNLLGVFLIDFWYLILIWISLCIALFYCYKKISSKTKEEAPLNLRSYAINTVQLILVLGIAVLGFRGGFQLIPIYNATAAEHANARTVPLVLNTAFSIIKTADQPPAKEFSFFDEKTANQICPTVHVFPNDTFSKKNVVILILESFSKEYTGYFNQGKGYTPFLDSLIKKSLVFENAYSNGRSSAQGIPAIIAGVPSLYEEPYLTSAYGANTINGMATLLKAEGYTTSFYHGGNNGTMGFHAFCSIAGFDEYYGRTEYGNEADFDGQWGIWDEPYLQYYCKNLSKTKEPFCSAVFTLSSHHPFKLPEKYTTSFPEGPHPVTKCISYTDMALKKFFETAAKTSWYKNTLFVITADHTGPAISNFYSQRLGAYSIPILFFDPGTNLQGKNYKLTQQIDITPSVMNYLGYSKPFFAFGQSALDSSSAGWAINFQNGNFELINNEYVLEFDGEHINSFCNWREDSLLTRNLSNQQLPAMQQLENKTKAFLQLYSKGLIHNKMRLK